jgi:two-component system, chemotaxis family, sensor kinase CheA
MSASDSVEIFRAEAQELLERLENGLLDLERKPDDLGTVATVFRALHTLKGSGAMYGFNALSQFAHHFETAFDRVRKGTAKTTSSLIAVSLRALDKLRMLAETPAATDDGCAALIADLEQTVGGKNAPAQWRIYLRFAPDALKNGTRPLPLLDELCALGDARITALTDDLPRLDTLIPDECRLAWEVHLATDRPRSDIDNVFVFAADDMTIKIESIGATDHPPAPPSQAADTAAAGPSAAMKFGETLRIPADRLDDLMNRIGELVIAQSRLKQVAQVSHDLVLRSVAEEIERLASDLRDSMMTVRMVPIAQLFGRFRRLIQDLARETGKKIDFITQGEATELDKSVIERLSDPLVHLIRNAVDHGLETPESRLSAGKPEVGRLTLSAYQTGTEVVIHIDDDGRGIDHAKVRAKAEENGLIQPGDQIGERELMQIIFLPGFSTVGTVTNLSGRGVGMDVVKRTIETLRGTIGIASSPGAGCRVSLRIPLTLAIIDGLLVRVGDARYVIPLAAVEECVELPADRDMGSQGCCMLTLRDRLVPFICLHEAFGLTFEREEHRKVVVVSSAGEQIGLVVDQIFGGHQTVIKPLSPFHTRVGSFSGATILGDGSVALIIDVANLIAAGRENEERRQAG